MIRSGFENDHLLPQNLTDPIIAAFFVIAPNLRYWSETVKK
jgi:hypothetical protein